MPMESLTCLTSFVMLNGQSDVLFCSGNTGSPGQTETHLLARIFFFFIAFYLILHFKVEQGGDEEVV